MNLYSNRELESKEAEHMPRTLVLEENKYTPPAPPTFTDRIPEGFMRNESLFVQTPKASLGRPYPLQNSHPVTATRSLATIHEGASSSITPSSSNPTPRQQPNKLPALTSSVRRGYWNRRGDHLTPEGYLVFPPKSMQ
jgi:hypothetical protein